MKIFLVVLSVAALAAAAACGSEPESTPTAEPTTTRTPTPTPAPEPTPTPSPITPQASPESPGGGSLPGTPPVDILESSRRVMNEAASFHLEMDAMISTNLGEGMSIDVPFGIEGDFQAPDRVKATIKLAEPLELDVQYISIGDDAYSMDPSTGLWILADLEQAQATSMNPIDVVRRGQFGDIGDFESLDIESLGTEMMGGVDLHRLVITLTPESEGAPEASPGEFDYEFWIGVDDGYVYRMSIDGWFSPPSGGGDAPASSGQPGEAPGVTFEAAITFSAFNAPVEIEPPDNFIEIEDESTSPSP